MRAARLKPTTTSLRWRSVERALDSVHPSGFHAAMGEEARTVTLLLRDWRAGDRAALDELMPQVYAELHRLAAGYLRHERPGHTLRPTELLSEAYLRLVGSGHPEWNDRVHFFAIAARVMRQILVDHARKRGAGKRGAGERPATLDEQIAAVDRPEELVALDAALVALGAFDERKARVVELHYFGGLTQEEIAAVLDVHVNTIARDLRVAEAWLHRELSAETA
jgi:RNA polymerase sigma factor (TIGR02999 family)